jgi:hypothetical protein
MDCLVVLDHLLPTSDRAAIRAC